MPDMSRTTAIVCGVLVEVALLGTLCLGDLRASVPFFFLLYGLSFGAYVVAAFLRDHLTLKTILSFGLVFRLTALVIAPSLSDDIYRYVWDGTVQAHGVNPYTHAPAAATGVEALYPLVFDPAYAGINHPELPTIYPPVAQIFFRFAAIFGASLWTVKVWLLVAEGLTAWFILGMLRAYEIDARALIFYLWHPLLLVEGCAEGHIDVLAIAFLVVALLYGQVSGPGRAAFALGLSAGVKMLPVAFLPLLWRWSTSPEGISPSGRVARMVAPRGWTVPLIFWLVVAGGYALYLQDGVSLLGSLGTYATAWEFNGLLFRTLSDVVGGNVARIVLFGAFVTAGGVVALSGVPVVLGTFTIIGVFLVTTPTLHPWYALWVLPFLPFYPARPWIVFTGVVALSHHVLIDYAGEGVWAESAWVAWVIWGSTALTALLVFLTKRKRGTPFPGRPR